MDAKVRGYFEAISDQTVNPSDREKAIDWRVYCFHKGRRLVRYLSENYGSLDSLDVLDVACGWGGHALAFAEAGANVTANDLYNHRFSDLERFAGTCGLNLKVGTGDCLDIPHPDNSFDLIVALELIEHVTDVSKFAKEVNRILRPNGIILISTPPRLRSIWEGEPHYHLRGLALLPFALQQFVGRKIFAKDYPFPIFRQYGRARAALKPFADLGLTVKPVISSERAKTLPKFLQTFLQEFHWSFLICQKQEF